MHIASRSIFKQQTFLKQSKAVEARESTCAAKCLTIWNIVSPVVQSMYTWANARASGIALRSSFRWLQDLDDYAPEPEVHQYLKDRLVSSLDPL